MSESVYVGTGISVQMYGNERMGEWESVYKGKRISGMTEWGMVYRGMGMNEGVVISV